MKRIVIATDFNRKPGGRQIKDGPASGELFRKTHLEPHFAAAPEEPLEVVLDGVKGYATSFLEEAFGGLAFILGPEKVLRLVSFISKDDPSRIEEIKRYIREGEAKRR